MKGKTGLLFRALSAYLCGALIMGALLFLPAGTLGYPGGWRLMGLLFVPMLVLGVFLFVLSPDLLRKRLNRRETEKAQSAVVAASAIMFIAAFVLAGLDYRFGITHVPHSLSAAASVLLLVSYALYAEVMRENAYLSRTVEIQQGQKVVDTGLYGVVRHPMYAVTLTLFLSMPLVLGSWISFAALLVYPPLIAARIRDEERLLRKGLPGYIEYTRRVKWRLIPYVW